MEIFDLIYEDDKKTYDESVKKVKEQILNAVVQDASDEIHGYRFTISVSMDEREYMKQMLMLGLALNSLHFQLNMREKTTFVHEIVNEWKEEGSKIIN